MTGDCPQHGERIPPGDARYDGFRIRHLWAFLAVDPGDNQEGFIPGPDGLPLFASDERRLEDLRPYAQAFARRFGVTVRLVRFGDGEEVERYS